MQKAIVALSCALFARSGFTLPQPQTDTCPIETICPAEDTPADTNSIPELDFPGLNLTALAEKEFFQRGPFDIINCGGAEDIVGGWLAETQAIAKQAYNNAALGTRSRYGFQALFKSQLNVPKVRDVYNKINTGPAPFNSGPSGNKRPAVVCVNDNDALPDKLKQACASTPRAMVSTDYPHAVLMCPKIIGLTTFDDARISCPTVVSNKLRPNNDWILRVPSAILVEEFAHMYVGLKEIFPEKYKVQDAVDLSEKDSLDNGPSYALYASGKFACCPQLERLANRTRKR